MKNKNIKLLSIAVISVLAVSSCGGRSETTGGPERITTTPAASAKAAASADKPAEGSQLSEDEASKALKHWMVDNPLGADVDMKYVSTDDKYYVYDLERMGYAIASIYIKKSDGEMTAEYYDYEKERTTISDIDEWYAKGTWAPFGIEEDYDDDYYYEDYDPGYSDAGSSGSGSVKLTDLLGTWTWSGVDIITLALEQPAKTFSVTFYSNGTCSGKMAEFNNPELGFVTPVEPETWTFLEYEQILQITAVGQDYSIDIFGGGGWTVKDELQTKNFKVSMSGGKLYLENSEDPNTKEIEYTKS